MADYEMVVCIAMDKDGEKLIQIYDSKTSVTVFFTVNGTKSFIKDLQGYVDLLEKKEEK